MRGVVVGNEAGDQRGDDAEGAKGKGERDPGRRTTVSPGIWRRGRQKADLLPSAFPEQRTSHLCIDSSSMSMASFLAARKTSGWAEASASTLVDCMTAELRLSSSEPSSGRPTGMWVGAGKNAWSAVEREASSRSPRLADALAGAGAPLTDEAAVESEVSCRESEAGRLVVERVDVG